MKKVPLLARIIIAIILGILIGSFSPEGLIELFATFTGLFGNFLSFIIPLIILGFIAPGIGSIGRGAGKMLGLTTGLAYSSTVAAGLLAFVVAGTLYPVMLQGQTASQLENPEESLVEAAFSVDMPPVIDVMGALILAFVIGLGISRLKSDALLNVMDEFRSIIQLVIEKVIIPLLPFHIFGIFANMTHAGQVQTILNVFWKVFIMIILLHFVYLAAVYTLAGSLHKMNPARMLRTMLPAYFTALGTQSSAATIPVTLERVKRVGVRERVADFGIPLLANVHLAGSTITITSCAMAVMYLQGQTAGFGSVAPFILMLGVTMIAAPGVPGGAVMAALGLLESMLGFGPAMTSLMIALYLAQDSFGTATNVTGDGALTTIANRFSK
ncbi:sodium:proton antiporter [Thalassobacillus devorans]|uniref:Sodium:proton antiporter n=1 Tax=Thalassobacillus devorans TaxID=279813 RepID=A0ABQ1NKL0_9BACI|nr:dicarboxylate/amino acid:cation symporter [Thalassobacillus devorans]NIK27613.1 Na+/H+-dicarboxylate symporter [Thalassobacillus devorans]GGC79154.1 sodium:proton antiporter [Thalassobacillus devorans]